MKTFFTCLCCLFVLLGFGQSETGKIGGRAIDETTGEYIPFAKVWLEVNGEAKYAMLTDFDGFFEFKNIPVGEYELHIRCIGYKEIIQNVKVQSSDTSMLYFEMDIVHITSCELYMYHQEFSTDKNREVGAPPQKGCTIE